MFWREDMKELERKDIKTRLKFKIDYFGSFYKLKVEDSLTLKHPTNLFNPRESFSFSVHSNII